MIQVHRTALEEVVIPYHEYLTSFKENRLFGFVEGKDDISYYLSKIAVVVDDANWDIKIIEAGYPKGNKEKLFRLLDLIDWNKHSRKGTVFFADRDVDDLLGIDIPKADNLYITDKYAIENDVVSFDTLKRVLTELYQVQLTDAEYAALEARFNRSLSLMCETIATIMVWYIVLYEQKHTVAYNSINLKDFCTIKECKLIVDNSKLNSCLSKQWCFNPVEYETIFDEVKFLFDEANQSNRCIRGKYLKWFFIKFIESFRSDCSSIIPRLVPPITGRQLDDSGFICDVCPRSLTPSSLVAFLERTHLAYISGCQG